ncbi:Trehalose-6-P synthase/phosphatase complex synthase subunit [Trebouxia sp. C0010 RCD-2024]
MADASGASLFANHSPGAGDLLGAQTTSAPASRSASPARRQGSVPLPNTLPTNRVDRLLLQRLRKSQSGTALYKEAQVAEEQQERSVHCSFDSGTSQRLLVVANRLPVSAYRDKQGKWQLQVSAGGLVSALMGVSNVKTMWVGWPGVYVEEGPDRDALTAALARENYLPVYLDPRTVDLHYNGFCNSVLWQLFHYIPLNLESKLSDTRTLNFQWKAHQEANRKFAEAVFDDYEEGDVVWCQDYHLMLLPALLKARYPKMKVGWFLHTPFPSSEIYRTLPVREEVLRAVLKADLIGFHTYDYARHFVSACTRILGLEGTPEGVEDNGSLTRVAAFPIGIDPERFQRALERVDVRSHIAELLNRYAGRKVMLGVDRLDMIKGIPQKLLAFEEFLEEHPEWRDKVLLVQIAVPSRTDVPEYQKLRSMVHEIVGRINGHYGTLTHVPIHHLDRQLSFHELCALYAITDVALVTSLRDGMNLVSYEYVACQSDNAGVLILSEFTGASQSLGAGAILVNPWNITDLSAAIGDALTMTDAERRERHRQNYMHIRIHTSQTWADTFISELNDTHVEAELRTKHIPPQLELESVLRDYTKSKRRLLVLGYNATLTTAVEAPRQPKRHFDQIQALTRVNPTVYNSIATLSNGPNTTVVVFSGSDKAKLDEVFGSLNVWLAAENGIFMRPPPDEDGDQEDWATMGELPKKEWMESVQLVFDYFCERTPRSFVEARDTSVVWNYKYADVEFGRLQARDLLQHLWTGPISNAPVNIVQGSKSVEVRPVGISKGLAMQRLILAMAERDSIEACDFEFVMVAGHFLARDENIFTFFEGVQVKPPEHSGRHLHHHQMHHRQGQATLSVLPETMEGAEIATTSQLVGGPPGPPPAQSSRRPARHPSPHTGPLLAHSHHRAYLREQATQLDNRMHRKSLDSGHEPFASDSDRDVEISSSRSAPETSYSMEQPRSSTAKSPLTSASRSASNIGIKGDSPAHSQQQGRQPPPMQQQQQHSQSARWRGRPSAESSSTTGPPSSTPHHHAPAPTHSYSSFSSGLPRPLELPPLPLKLPPKHLYTCTVGRNRSQARFFVHGSTEIAALLAELADASSLEYMLG